MPGNTPISCSLRFSQSGICGRQRPQKSTNGDSYSRRPLPFLPHPHPFFASIPPYSLPLSTPATRAKKYFRQHYRTNSALVWKLIAIQEGIFIYLSLFLERDTLKEKISGWHFAFLYPGTHPLSFPLLLIYYFILLVLTSLWDNIKERDPCL